VRGGVGLPGVMVVASVCTLKTRGMYSTRDMVEGFYLGISGFDSFGKRERQTGLLR
jgi:hypothetical protein